MWTVSSVNIGLLPMKSYSSHSLFLRGLQFTLLKMLYSTDVALLIINVFCSPYFCIIKFRSQICIFSDHFDLC